MGNNESSMIKCVQVTYEARGYMQENKKEVPWLLEYISCLIYLAVFGILGVIS